MTKRAAPTKPAGRMTCGDPRCSKAADLRYSFILHFKLLSGEHMRYSFCSPEHKEDMRPWLEKRRMILSDWLASDENEGEQGA